MRRVSDISEKAATAQLVLMLVNAPDARLATLTVESAARMFGVREHIAREKLSSEIQRRARHAA